MEIITKRFLLRDFVEADRSSFVEYQADPHSQVFYEPGATGSEHTNRLFDTFQMWASEQPRRNYQLAIVQHQEPCALVGCCGLRGSECDTGEMELGIELAPIYWGRYAYAIEVGRAMLDFGFRELQLNIISGSTVSANTRMTRLAEWGGAEVIEIRPGVGWMSDRGWSELHWQITRERWHQNSIARHQKKRFG
jgi:[ribosomal protein S5]-alanine N-acetyltransferase